MSEDLFNEYIQETTDFINNTIKKKYLINDETCYEDIINNRFKNELKKIEPNQSRINYIINMFKNKTALPAGSILNGLGNTEHSTSLSNCYYTPIEKDSIEGIYECQKKLAKTFSRRGGSGTSITILRPKNTPVSNSAKTSTGAVSFMPGFSLLAHDIGQNGRRAALIITIDCRHPDVLDFIWCKSKPELVFDKDSLTDYQPNISYANISIQITNDFMEAAKNNTNWDLFFPDTTFEKYDDEWDGDYDKWIKKGYPTKIYKTINARDLLNQIAEAAWLTGDPGLSFKDNVIKYSTGSFDSKITPRGLNPCLPDWAPILTSDGYKLFKNLKNKIYLDGNIWSCSDLIKTHNAAELYEIELKSGLRLYGTEEHLVQCTNEKDFIFDLPINQLKINDFVKVDYNKINYIHDDLEWKKGYFCGMIYADGSIANKTTRTNYKVINFSLGKKELSQEKEFTEFISEMINEPNFSFTQHNQSMHCKVAAIQKKQITNKILNWMGCQNKYDIDLFDKTMSFQLGFINAMVGHDGYITIQPGRSQIISIHQAGIEGNRILSYVQLILASMGIYSRLGLFTKPRKHQKGYNNREVWILGINDVETFYKEFKLFHKEKQNKLDELYKIIGSVKAKRIQTLKTKQRIKNFRKLDGKYPVYDIKVPGPNSMVSSAIVVHNCAEQTLQDYGNCLLSCLCLHKYVKNPYTPDAEFDFENYLLDVEHLVYFLDLMIDINKHPLPEQIESDLYSRRIGIEFTGLHDMWAMLNLDYGSDKACEFIDGILFSKTVHEIKTSIKLAKEKGHAPCFKYKKKRQAFIDQPYIQRIFKKLLKTNREELINDILTYGLRNSAFNTIGPTGTLSIISDNCSSGIEPIYNISYERESRLFPDKKLKMVHLPLVKAIGPEILNLSKDEIKKKYHYIPAHDINFNKRIKVQSTIQKWIDNSISSTINLNNDATIEDIYSIYLSAYEKNLKGITIYRDGCKKGILSLSNEPKVKNKKTLITNDMIKEHINLERDELLKVQRSYRYVKFWKKIKVYIIVVINNIGKPIEIFTELPLEAGINNSIYQPELLMEKRSHWESICRLSSLLLRINTPVELIIKQLEKSSPIMTEASHMIAQVLKGFVNYSDEKIEEIKTQKIGGMYCNHCKTESIIYQGGCEICLNCGESRCG